ncbi:MAG: hypothetical protein WCO84_08630 [bacterium]
MTLNETRMKWEKGLTPLVLLDKIAQCGYVLVVLQNGKIDKYHLHRYFPLGLTDNNWACSVDGQYIPLEGVWSWLNDPCANSTRPSGYVKPEPI